ncbi:hypothetical protein [Sulfurimonas sp.]|uniref:hypothetical protein n=1 Tax=Sulfurimonas sp. TaxID=2022749 RepID=UPI003D0D210A
MYCSFLSILHADDFDDFANIQPQATSNFNSQQTYLARTLSNHDMFYDPYTFVLLELQYKTPQGIHLDFGADMYSDSTTQGIALNQASLQYSTDRFDFKVGKFVETLGVLDYLSITNITNPPRTPFFDDSNINIRKLPLLMASASTYLTKEFKVQAIAQPFDKNLNYTNVYLNTILKSLLPFYLNSVEFQNNNFNIIRDEIFLPSYNEQIADALNTHIQNKYKANTTLALNKASFFLLMQYDDFDATYGFIWTNHYSEVQYIQIDENFFNSINDILNEQDSGALDAYLSQENLDPISSISTYRYDQVTAYYESSYKEIGIRSEISYRDKIPTINTLSSLSSIAIGLDHKSTNMYNSMELQYLHVPSLPKDVFTSTFVNKTDSCKSGAMEMYMKTYILGGYYNGEFELSVSPSVVIDFEVFNATLQFYHSKLRPELDTFSLTLKATLE